MTTLYNTSFEWNEVFHDLSSVRYDPEAFFVDNVNYSLTPLPTSAFHGNQESRDLAIPRVGTSFPQI